MKDIIKLHDRKFKIMIPAEKIDEAVSAVAQRINEDYGDKETPLFVGVLNGSFMFMSDLIKKIEFNNELSFVKLASYEGTCSTGCVKNLIGLNNSIEGRHVIIVEDIVDTGESIEHMIGELKSHNPASIEVCTLFFKPDSYRKQLPIKYRAMEIGNEFIVGYGLDCEPRLFHPPGRMRRGMPLVRRQIHVEPQALSPDRRTDGDRPCYGVSRAGDRHHGRRTAALSAGGADRNTAR